MIVRDKIPNFYGSFIQSQQHRDAFCQFPFWWIYYCHSSKSTGKETVKMHLCALCHACSTSTLSSIHAWTGTRDCGLESSLRINLIAKLLSYFAQISNATLLIILAHPVRWKSRNSTLTNTFNVCIGFSLHIRKMSLRRAMARQSAYGFIWPLDKLLLTM